MLPEVIHSDHAQATSYTLRPSTDNQLYRQRKHRQPVIQAAQAQTTSSTGTPGPENKQLIVQAGEAQAISYTGSANTGNQLYRQRKQRQPIIQAAQAQATSSTSNPGPENKQLIVQAGENPHWVP